MKAMAVLLLCVLSTLTGCAAARPDRAAAEQHRQNAQAKTIDRDFTGAATEMALALEKDPKNGQLYLENGEILEAADRPQEAAATYDKGRRVLRDQPSLHQELTYRLGLLAAGRLDDGPGLQKLLTELPVASIPRRDLEGLLALRQGEARQALVIFNDALQMKPGKGMAARILYHAALAYHRLGDDKNTFGSLYRAVNLAEDVGLLREIELFYLKLNRSVPAQHPDRP